MSDKNKTIHFGLNLKIIKHSRYFYAFVDYYFFVHQHKFRAGIKLGNRGYYG